MSLYSIAKKTRMVLQAKGWSQERLAREAEVTTRHIYNLLHAPDEKRRVVPKGAAIVERLFDELYPSPVPARLATLYGEVERIAWLKRNKARCQDELAASVAHWLRTFAFFVPPPEATADDLFVAHLLRGHTYFAAVFDVSLADDHELAGLFAAERRGVYMAEAIDGFRSAVRLLDLDRQSPQARDRYRLPWSTAVGNLGAAIYMGYARKLVPGLGLDDVKACFATPEHDVGAALGYLHAVDPKDARVPFNMCCWSSVLADEAGCRAWFARLVAADPVFADVGRRHHWMARSMRDDPDFAFLIRTVLPGAAAVPAGAATPNSATSSAATLNATTVVNAPTTANAA